MENTKYGKRREGRWTPIRAKLQDTRANPNSWETHLVRKRWDIGLLRALSLWIMMMMMMKIYPYISYCNITWASTYHARLTILQKHIILHNVLHHLLPPTAQHAYGLRPRPRNYVLPLQAWAS